MDRLINLLVSINNNHFKRRLFFFMPLLTILLSLFNIVNFLPEKPSNAVAIIPLILVTVYYFYLYRKSHKRDLLCMVVILDLFLCSVLSFIATLETIMNHNYALVFCLMIALIFAIFILIIIVWFSPRRYG